MPQRKTPHSAGYDFEVAESITIPPYCELMEKFDKFAIINNPIKLSDMAYITKKLRAKPALVPTGVCCQLNNDEYLELSVRSSTPLKYWLIMANGVGIIDADYFGNKDNDGEIYFQLINLSPFPIELKKGDIIGQGIIKHYLTTDDDVPA